MFTFDGISYIAIIIATFINVGIGAWWYSPAGFGKLWTRLTGVDMHKTPKSETNRAIAAVFVGAVVQSIVLATVLLSLGVNTVMDGVIAAFVLWLGFIAAPTIGESLYSRRGWKFWWLGASYFLVVMVISGGIIGWLQ